MSTSKRYLARNVSLAWPLALNAILVQSMAMVDLMLIAPLGEISIAALGVSSSILGVLIGTQYALANGAQLIIARKKGANDSLQLSKAVLVAWMLNLTVTLCCCIFLWCFGASLFEWLIPDERVAQKAYGYIYICLFMLITSSFSQVMIAYFNGLSRTKVPLYGYFFEIPINALVSFVLINGLLGAPALGIEGAALGSLVAVLIRASYLVFQLRRVLEAPLGSTAKNVTKADIVDHGKEAFPIAINFVVLAIGTMIHQMLFAQLDVYSFAAITLVLPWMQMGAQFVTSWSLATAILVSQQRGRGETKDIPHFVRHASKVALAVGVVLSLFFVGFSQAIPFLYPAIEEKTLIALAAIAPAYILIPLVRTYNGLCGHTLRALGNSVIVLRIHFVTQWIIGIPILYLMLVFDAPLWAIYGIVLFEECLKVYFFRTNLNGALRTVIS